MRRIVQQSQFRRDYKRQKRRGKNIAKLDTIVALLMRDGLLAPVHHPHKLSGEYSGCSECHIEPDWLLIYEVSASEIALIRTGSHADLFE